MRLIRIALASVNATVGAVRGNVDRCISAVRTGASEQATVVVFPEQVVGGYPQEDLVQWRASSTRSGGGSSGFARETADTAVRRRRRRDRGAAEGSSTTARRCCTAGASWASSRRRSSPRTTSSTRRARFARGGAGLVDRRPRRALRRSGVRARLRHRGARGLRGRVVARRSDAASLLRGRRARR